MATKISGRNVVGQGNNWDGESWVERRVAVGVGSVGAARSQLCRALSTQHPALSAQHADLEPPRRLRPSRNTACRPLRLKTSGLMPVAVCTAE